MKAVHDFLDAFVDERVMRDVPRPVFQLRFGRQFTVQQQISNLQISALFSELVDRIPTVFKDAFIAIDKGDAALGRGRIHEGGIVGHQTKVVIGNFDLSQVQRFDRFVFNRDFILLSRAIVGNC